MIKKIEMEVNEVFKKKYLPEGVWVNPVYGRHAKQRFKERSKGSLAVLPTRIKIVKENIVRVKMEGDTVDYFLYCIPYNKREELILVLAGNFFVKSLWYKQQIRKKCTS